MDALNRVFHTQSVLSVSFSVVYFFPVCGLFDSSSHAALHWNPVPLHLRVSAVQATQVSVTCNHPLLISLPLLSPPHSNSLRSGHRHPYWPSRPASHQLHPLDTVPISNTTGTATAPPLLNPPLFHSRPMQMYRLGSLFDCCCLFEHCSYRYRDVSTRVSD